MKHKEYFKDFDDFDYESQQVLLSAYNSVLTPNTFHQNKLQSKVFSQKSNNAIESPSDNIDWETHEYINLDLLIGKIKLSNSGFWNYQFTYNPKELKSIAPNKSINNGKGGQIPLKVYRNPKIGNVGVKWDEARITQTIDVQKRKIYYRLHFYYKDSNESAFILETEYYKEFRDLNILLNYGDVDEYKADYDYFLKNFANALRNESDAARLKFIYKNIPESILSNLSTLIDNETFFNHLEILSADDDSNIFKDSSTAVIQIFKTFDNPIPILNYYRQNPDRLNRLYYNLDRNSEYDGKIISNKMVLANIMMVLSMRAQNENRKKTAKTFTLGKGYKINSDILEFGALQGGNKKYSNTFFLQQQKDELQRAKIIPKEGDPDAMETVTVDMDQGGEFHPLDMVYLKDLNEEKEVMYLVPAIYLKALADAEEWKVVMQNIRIAADLVAVVIGVLTLPTGNPYFLLLAIADITLAGADLTIQAFREQILQIKGGADFLNTWDSIYAVGGALTGGVLLISSFYKLGLKLLTLPEVVKNIKLQNTIKTYMLKVFLEINISNFEGNTIKILTQETEVVTATSGAINEFKLKKLFEKECFLVSGNVAENGKAVEEFALVYKGEVIAQGNKTDFYKKIKEIGRDIYRDGKLTDALENMYKKAIFEFEEFSKSVPEFATDSALAKESYKLFKQQKWKELEELFKARNINGVWPPNRGAFEVEEIVLDVGVEIDRYGGKIKDGVFTDTGNFVSPKDTEFSKRALPESYISRTKKSYIVMKPILKVKKGKIIPWFGQRGLGIQYELSKNIDQLLKSGYIKLK